MELWKPELCFKLSWKGDQSKASVDKYLTWPWSIIISGLSEKLSDGVWAGKCDHAVWESRHWHLHHGLQVCWWLKMKWFYFHLSQYVKIHLFCSLSIDGLLTTEHWVHIWFSIFLSQFSFNNNNKIRGYWAVSCNNLSN